jgi:hypothetical protein
LHPTAWQAVSRGRSGRSPPANPILKPLAAADRLDVNRRGWISRIEAAIAELEQAAAE